MLTTLGTEQGSALRVVIVGAGQAGLSVADKLRTKGFKGSVTMIGAERHAPYQRPPLSKAYLMGKTTEERLLLKPLAWYLANSVTLLTETQVTKIDRAGKLLAMSGGGAMPYDHLVLATGAQARPMPETMGGNLEGVFTIRNLADIDSLRPRFETRQRLLIIGGGYIGLEIAAVARSLGLDVNVVEAADRLLARVACAQTAREVENLHHSKGVKFHLGKTLIRLMGKSQVKGALLNCGTEIEADFVVAGIGALPNTELAVQAGLDVKDGIVVDPMGRTRDRAIWAVGDCASFNFSEGPMRLESVGNAIDSADVVASNIMGAERSYAPKPWFWSDQYDLKLQIAGLSRQGDDVVIRQNQGISRSHWYFRNECLVAVDGLNAPRDYLVGKRLLAARVSPNPTHLANTSIALDSFLENLPSVAQQP